nr:hypothetical protein [Gammaproteobacteria bacterium]
MKIKKLQYIVSRTLILLLPALLLAACAASKKSDDATNPVSVFSHNSYNFAPANIDIPTDGARTPVANIFVNENEVKKLVAGRLGIGDDQDAIAGLRYNDNYTLSYRVNAALTSNANTFFAVEQDGSNPLQVNILVGDTIGAQLSFAGIIQLVPSFSVEVSIQVPQATASRRIIKTSVRVAFQERDADYSLNNVFTNNIARLSNNITFEPTAKIAENNRITAAATLSRRGNILSEYALQRDSSTAGITLFLALRETNDFATDCGNGDIYLDNTDLRVKTARTYNYEDISRPSYACRLSVSDDGINYQPLVIVADATSISTINSRGNSIVGSSPIASVPSAGNAVFIGPASNSSIGCSDTN